MADIFISYARADRDRVEKLASELTAEGYSVWWDRQIVGGAEFSEEIEKELHAAKAVIVAWSQTSVKSRWVRDEAGTAAEAQKLIPVAIDDAAAPMGFKQYHVLDLNGWSGKADTPEFRSLAHTVKARITGATDPAPTNVKKGFLSKLRSKRKESDGHVANIIKGVTIVAIVFVAMKYSGPKPSSPRNSPDETAIVTDNNSRAAGSERRCVRGASIR